VSLGMGGLSATCRAMALVCIDKGWGADLSAG